jgi:hypothetical protein
VGLGFGWAGLFDRADVLALQPLLDGIRTPDEAEDLLIGAVRMKAATTAGVGPNCLAVRLTPGHATAFTVRYSPTETAEDRGYLATDWPDGENRGFFPAAFNPWIVGHGVMVAPEVISPTSPPRASGGSVSGLVWGQNHDFVQQDPEPDSDGLHWVSMYTAQQRPHL